MTQLTILKQRKQAQYFTEPLDTEIGLEMILVMGGSFNMGSPKDELDQLESETPQPLVTVPTFFMGRYPITQAQWKSVVDWRTKFNVNLEPNPSHFNSNPNHPVETVSWIEAEEFCNRLAQKTGRSYRLPTEAEWEYACRAGTTTPFHFGETISTDLANYRGTDLEIDRKTYSGSYGRGPKGTYIETTTPVGSVGYPNAFGLWDMHGNAWEWCQDNWHSNYKGAPIDGSAWLTGNENDTHVVRGGSWYDNPWACRSAARNYGTPDYRSSIVGFRLVCDLDTRPSRETPSMF
jgi:formylglycine-generating enzyme required for sulfatase activity